MRKASVLFVLALAAVSAAFAKDDTKRRAKPLRPGIRWQADLQEGLARAIREGRPILFAINAREDERANIELATRQYRSPAWGEATREYVAFVCNPNDHKGADGLCTRYPGIPCATHKAALTMVAQRFGADLITPQHIILEPDQKLAYRKEYYERVVDPALLESWLSAIAPDLAFSRAGIAREMQIEALLATPAEERAAKAQAWLLSGDGLAVAALANVIDSLLEAPERLAMIAALAKSPRRHASLLENVAEDRIAYPDEDAPETVAWIQAMLHVDRPIGLRAAARAISRSTDSGNRGRILHACLGATNIQIQKIVAEERYALWEALALAGDKRGGPNVSALPEDPIWRARLLRAIRRGGLATGAEPVDLDAALQQPDDVATLRSAMLRASAEQTRKQRVVIEQILDQTRWLGLRAAAAVALLRAGVETSDDLVVRTLQATLFDPVEGPDIRAVVQGLLGEDPGTDVDEWIRMVKTRIRKSEGAK